jgi:hypothetical protein
MASHSAEHALSVSPTPVKGRGVEAAHLGRFRRGVPPLQSASLVPAKLD